MHSGPSQLQEYAKALAVEKAAWEAVRGSLPGSSHFDPQLWQRWRSAMEEADQAAARAKTTVAVLVSAHPSRFFGKSWPTAIRLPPILGGPKRPD